MFALNKCLPLKVRSSQSKFDCVEWQGGWGSLAIPVNTGERETFAVTRIK